MQSLVSLNGFYSPEISEYLQSHKWPTLMEALISGVCVMLPEDPWDFMHSSVMSIKENGITDNIQWDTFIDPAMRPRLPPLHRGIFDPYAEDDEDLPTEEVLQRVYGFRRDYLCKTCLRAWKIYHKDKLEKRRIMAIKLSRAISHHRYKQLCLATRRWHCYAKKKVTRRASAIKILKDLFHSLLSRRCFTAWQSDTIECKKARMFFQNRNKSDSDEGVGEEWFYPEGEDPISLFPRHISIKIFSEMGVRSVCRCAQVCRTWREITEDPKLWSKIDLSPIGHYVTDSSVIQLLTKFRPLLCYVNFRGCSLLSSESFMYLASCQNLQDINLSECQGITDNLMKNISTGCQGLFYLNLSYCFITDSVIRILTKYCISLNYLSLAYCSQFTCNGLQSIVSGKGCRKLIHLDLSGCNQLNEEAFNHLGQGCPILQTLVLNDMASLTDDCIINLATHCHTLKHLSLLGCTLLTDRGLKFLALENRKIRSLRFDNNPVVSDSMLRTVAKSCRDLQILSIPGCTHISDQGLKAVGHLKKLHVLNLADCTRLSDAGIRYIVEGSSGTQLRELNLTNCSKLSDVSPLRISQHCHNLRHLSFCFCEHISDTGIELISQITTLLDLDVTGCDLTDQGVASISNSTSIRYITANDLYEITDDGVMKMSQGLVNLEMIDLCGCEKITDNGIQSLTFNCQLLRVIKLANCPLIRDNSAKFISQGCMFVDTVDLSGTGITDQSLRHIRKGCQNLKQLTILCCVNVSKEAVVKLEKQCSASVEYSTDPPSHHYNEAHEGILASQGDTQQL